MLFIVNKLFILYLGRFFMRKIIIGLSVLLLSTATFNSQAIASSYMTDNVALSHLDSPIEREAKAYLNGTSAKRAQEINMELSQAARENNDPDHLRRLFDLQRAVREKGKLSSTGLDIVARTVYDLYSNKVKSASDLKEVLRLYFAQKDFYEKEKRNILSGNKISGRVIYDAFENEAGKISDPSKLVKLYHQREDLFKEENLELRHYTNPHSKLLPRAIYKAFKDEADKEPDLLTKARLFEEQADFSEKEAKSFTPFGDQISLNGIRAAYYNKLFNEKLAPDDYVRIYEEWAELSRKHPDPSLVSSGRDYSHPFFVKKYEEAKAEVAKNQALVPSLHSMSLDTVGGGEALKGDSLHTFKGLKEAYGAKVIDTSSLKSLQDSFSIAYRRLSPVFHPDTSGKPSEGFLELQAWKERIDRLTPAEFDQLKRQESEGR